MILVDIRAIDQPIIYAVLQSENYILLQYSLHWLNGMTPNVYVYNSYSQQMIKVDQHKKKFILTTDMQTFESNIKFLYNFYLIDQESGIIARGVSSF